MIRQGTIIVSFLVCSFVMAAAAHAAGDGCRMTPERQAALAARLPQGVTVDRSQLQAFYALEDGRCVWTASRRNALLRVLGEAGGHALSPALFHAETLTQLSADSDTAELVMSDAALRYIRVMATGRVAPSVLAKDIAVQPMKMDAPAALAAGLRAPDLADWLHRLGPRDPAYDRLRRAYEAYRARKGEFRRLSLGSVRALHPGDASPIVPELAARLIASGDADRLPSGTTYSPEIEMALRHYQARHGLEVDGVLGRQTLAELNTPPSERVERIALNLERWRVLAHALPPTRIEVNAAAAEARVIRNGKTELFMRAIVGKKKTQTPIIVSQAGSVLINPPWNVPSSITKNELQPKIAKDATYLERHNMEWVDGRLVQAPGEDNSLGQLKIDFPSPFAVYMHDTNARSLFARDYRWLSHGCIRLQKPREMASVLLGGDDAREEIDRLIGEGETVRLPVAERLAVAVMYWTAFVTEDGTVNFRDDIYGRDARLKAALQKSANPDKPAPPVEACGM